MHRTSLVMTFVSLVLAAAPVLAAEPRRMTMEVEGQEREWLVFAPATAQAEPTPVVFAFHGHGGSMQNAARSFRIHTHWPEAIVVYPQGLPTATRLDPQGQRAGWSTRDVTFVDAMLQKLQAEYRVDERRLYCMGHSNGGGFTYTLWALRGERWAALAPSAAAPQPERAARLRPLPLLHLAGRTDQVVRFADQERTMAAVRERNGCEATGKPWEEHGTWYESKAGAPMVAYIHAGGHRFPSEFSPAIVKFFKSQVRPERTRPEGEDPPLK